MLTFCRGDNLPVTPCRPPCRPPFSRAVTTPPSLHPPLKGSLLQAQSQASLPSIAQSFNPSLPHFTIQTHPSQAQTRAFTKPQTLQSPNQQLPNHPSTAHATIPSCNFTTTMISQHPNSLHPSTHLNHSPETTKLHHHHLQSIHQINTATSINHGLLFCHHRRPSQNYRAASPLLSRSLRRHSLLDASQPPLDSFCQHRRQFPPSSPHRRRSLDAPLLQRRRATCEFIDPPLLLLIRLSPPL